MKKLLLIVLLLGPKWAFADSTHDTNTTNNDNNTNNTSVTNIVNNINNSDKLNRGYNAIRPVGELFGNSNPQYGLKFMWKLDLNHKK